MAGKNKSMTVASSKILWVAAAVLLLTGPASMALDVTGSDVFLFVEEAYMPEGDLIANLSAEITLTVFVDTNYTLNLLSGSVVHWLIAQGGSSVNIEGGTIDYLGFSAGDGCAITISGTYVGHTPEAGMHYDDAANALVFDDGFTYWDGDLVFMYEGATETSVIPLYTSAVINFDTADQSDPTQVEIDIKPGSYPNSINLDSRGVVPVALLSGDGFNAADIDPAFVMFAGASPVHWALEDVDDDGNMDMVLHFRTQKLADLDEDSTEAMLWTTEDSPIQIQGTDTVKILTSKKKK